MTFPLAGTIVLTVVVAAALVTCRLLRRRSAAWRHAVLAAALLVGAAAPALGPLLPAWELQVGREPVAASPPVPPLVMPTPVDAVPALAPPEAVRPARATLPLSAAITFVWIAGAMLVLAGLATGLVRLAHATRRCRPVMSGPWRDDADAVARRLGLRRAVTLLQSADPFPLLTWGLRRPRIILPPGAEAWSAERRALVLTHELAHIRRHDWAVQMAAEIVGSVHWFNPLVRVACRRLRRESEQACDDTVLSGGVAATTYASHLLAVARHAAGHPEPRVPAPAVATPSTLERRVAAMLSRAVSRDPLTHRVGALAIVGALAVTVPLAAVSLTQRVEGSAPPDTAAGQQTPGAPATPEGPATPTAPLPPSGNVGLPAPDPVPTVPDAGSPPAHLPVPAPTRPAASAPGPRVDRVGSVRVTIPRAPDAPAGAAAVPPVPVPAVPRGDAATVTPVPPAPVPVPQVPGLAAPLDRLEAVVMGTVRDVTGGVVPGVRMTLTDMNVIPRFSTVTEANGRFRIRNVQPGRYYLVANSSDREPSVWLRGFATVTSVVDVASSAEVDRQIVLPLGTLEEAIAVACPAADRASAPALLQLTAFVPAADAGVPRLLPRMTVQPRLQPPAGAGAAQAAPLPAPVRVGGNFRFPERVTTARPSCPPDGLSGDTVTVVLGGRIGGDGAVHDARPSTAFGSAAPAFVEAALEAFRRWTYAPPRLNGQPVDVDVRVQVVFERAGGPTSSPR
jgi:beta-lactamase regulating signal transducer with metallopeptidase domain